MKDPYAVLGLDRSATQAEIKSAFRKQGAKHHPDRNPDDAGAAQRFKEVNAAYQILNDPKKRAMFDRFGAAGLGASRGGGPFGGMPIDLSDLNIDGVFGDLLEVLGIRLGDRGNIQTEVALSFEEAAFGCTKEISYQRVRTCAACGGSGGARNTDLEPCPACGGRGRLRLQQGVFPIAVERRCAQCRGTGKVMTTPCADCGGAGLRTADERVEISVSRGAEGGATRRIEGMGNMVRGRKAGHLEVTFRVRPHELFRRSGDNVLCTLPVTFAQAVLGDEVEIPTLDGKGILRVPAGTQPGTVLRVRGKGIPRRLRGGRGDQLIEVQVEVPTQLSERQQELVLELAEALGESVQPQRRTFAEKLRDLFN